jgi:uncharacterized protein YjbI with pentapeptide repeats
VLPRRRALALYVRVSKGTNFSGANINSVTFANSDLSGANLSGVQAGNNSGGGRNTEFIDVSLTGANFTNATLGTQTVFEDANLTGATFTGADVSGATWNNVICPDSTNSNNNGNTCEGHL